MKRILALLLACVMLISNVQTIFADDVSSNGILSFTKVNPMYEGDLAESLVLEDESGASISTYADGDYTTDVNAIVSSVRSAMVGRKTSYSIKYKSYSAVNQSWFDDLMDRVFAETANPKEGDYLEAHYKGIHLGGSYTLRNGAYYNDFLFTFEYRTNASQEAEVDRLIPVVLERIQLKKWMSEYDKIKAIYDYVRNNVEYDYTHSDSYDLKYSAYAGLVNGTAVCNGYAALFYRLAKTAGFDVRIVKGSSKGEAHAWNLIKLADKYYYLDPTWDSGILYTLYFMKGTTDFPDHTAESDFLSGYNISPRAYDMSLENSSKRGSCGPLARWVLVNDDTLIIYGAAMVNDMSGISAHKNKIKNIYVYDTVTGITGDVSFEGYTALESISVARKDFLWGLDSANDIPGRVVLIGHAGTTMQTYANRFGYPFETYVANPFLDVEESDYFFEPVAWAIKNKITTGVDTAHFAPNQSCNRAQAVTFIWRAYGQPATSNTNNPFVDVASDEYYYHAVLWAVDKGITTGVDKTHFNPADTLTRAQFVTFLWRAAGEPQPHDPNNPFKDVKSSDYYYKAVLWAVENNITTGMSKTQFGPDSVCTRGQVVTFLHRAFE